MSIFWAIYFYSVMQNLSGFLHGHCVVVLVFIYGIVSALAFIFSNNDKATMQSIINVGKRFVLPFLIVMFILALVTPTEKQLNWLVGGYIADKAMSDGEIREQLKKLPVGSLAVVNQGLEGLAGFAKDLTTVLDK